MLPILAPKPLEMIAKRQSGAGLVSVLLAAAAFAIPPPDQALGAEARPNVVLILADNVGYGDLGPYGGGELRGFPTPRIDELARAGLRLTQYLVEPACTPSRAALMTGQYSIRNGLSLVLVPGTANTLAGDAFTMGDMFHAAGYATAIFGKWHLGRDPQSLPTAHGFDEFYGIPPDWSWDSATYLNTIRLTHSYTPQHEAAFAAETMIVEATAGGLLRDVKPYTPEVRAEIDNELTDKAIDFIRRERAAAKPFFLYLPFSMGHYPNLPSKAFAGKSRIGDFGDKMMEGDFHVGEVMDALKDLGVDSDTIVIFASDNGPQGMTVRELGNSGTPDSGFSGPFRGELGDASEGAIRTCALIRWPGHVKPDTTSYAMVSEMDLLPTLARIVGGKLPTDRPIDGVDQSHVLYGTSALGNRESLLTFVGPDLVAVRWKQWRVYYRDIHATGEGVQRLGGLESASSEMNGYPKIFNIEMDPGEQLNVAFLFPWVLNPALKAVFEYERSVKSHPNTPAPNVTRFRGGG
jgi:arylsulfatase A-like enzyme